MVYIDVFFSVQQVQCLSYDPFATQELRRNCIKIPLETQQSVVRFV